MASWERLPASKESTGQQGMPAAWNTPSSPKGVRKKGTCEVFFNDEILLKVATLERCRLSQLKLVSPKISFQIESQNRIGWKRRLRSPSPTVNLTLPRPPLYHVPKHLIQMSFKYLQGWQLNHFPGQPVPMLDNLFGEDIFPNTQSKPPLAQLEAISSCPITCYLGEETNPHLSTTSFQVVVESDKVSPQPPFLQAKQPQFPQPLLIRLLLQTLHQLCCPSLDSLQCLNVSLVVKGPKLNTVFEVRPHQCRVQGHDHLFIKPYCLICNPALFPVLEVWFPVPRDGECAKELARTWWAALGRHVHPVPMLDNPFSEVTFPNIQSKPPLAQLEAISSCPITCYLGEETDPHLSTASFQVVVESNKVSPQPPFLQAKQSQFPQPLLIRLLLQTLHQLRCPSLDSLQHLHVSLVVGGPKLNTGHDHSPSPAGHAISDTSQDAIGFLGHLGTLLAHIQAAVNQHAQVLLCQAAFQPLFPKPVALHGVAVAQVQDLALGLVKPHTIDLGPSIQPVQVPLQSLPTLKQTNTPTQLGIICKLTEGTLDTFAQIIDKDVKQNWPQHRALGNTACDWPPTGVNSIHHHSLGPAIQPVLYPAKSTPVQAMSSQFLQENAVGNRVKGFTDV
ncbi:hypothetical protein QYF61_010438 [Mycteria americana]|uniref:Uncharacterized protein n=1 Tax=Mycteria americana TaxID=33587 RepID=A0AAN7S3L0_MYCAM|nr:hypothetical protein QYF61_010438 [Mycteria americana]